MQSSLREDGRDEEVRQEEVAEEEEEEEEEARCECQSCRNPKSPASPSRACENTRGPAGTGVAGWRVAVSCCHVRAHALCVAAGYTGASAPSPGPGHSGRSGEMRLPVQARGRKIIIIN